MNRLRYNSRVRVTSLWREGDWMRCSYGIKLCLDYHSSEKWVSEIEETCRIVILAEVLHFSFMPLNTAAAVRSARLRSVFFGPRYTRFFAVVRSTAVTLRLTVPSSLISTVQASSRCSSPIVCIMSALPSSLSAKAVSSWSYFSLGSIRESESSSSKSSSFLG
jgi:hypothetical protein